MCKEPNSGNPDESQDDSLIETGLKAAFGPARPAAEYHSVIDELGDQASRIHLANPEGDHSPLVSTQAAGAQEAGRRVGRYLVEGQIADGDAGPILKCRDGDLGREVAMKLLKKDLCDDLEAVRTFIEEAQIGAQLTHPGIIPVYELGLLADEQPYFTMKLVKGRPLSELLTERKDASDDLRRYLGIFEQICQAMAYAHTRDVIHRNLEPDNVLVGDYGEVKIIDWGFSRVKVPEDRSRYPDSTQSQISLIETIRGLEEDGEEQSTRVFGGPAYMSPEQAMGDVRRLDQRSDVFSLGAILFEIVTGRPPYTGKTSEEIVFKATRARLDWALTHLEESDVDRDLADIVRDSLSPAKQTRPRDARVLSDRITKWLGHAEEEARRGRIRAAEEHSEDLDVKTDHATGDASLPEVDAKERSKARQKAALKTRRRRLESQQEAAKELARIEQAYEEEERVRESCTTQELRMAQATVKSLEDRMQQVDDLLESLQEEEWADEEEGILQTEPESTASGSHVSGSNAPATQKSNELSLLDGILAMILGSASKSADINTEDHYKFVRKAHQDVVSEWREYFGRLPPSPPVEGVNTADTTTTADTVTDERMEPPRLSESDNPERPPTVDELKTSFGIADNTNLYWDDSDDDEEANPSSLPPRSKKVAVGLRPGGKAMR